MFIHKRGIMKRKFILLSHLLLMMACLFIAGCVKLDVTPTNKFTDETYWQSEDKANSVLNMAYRQMFSSDYLLTNEILSDNVYNGYGTPNEKVISNGLADASNGRFEGEWGNCYGGIKTCHTFLENVDRVTAMDPALREKEKLKYVLSVLHFTLN